MKKAFPAPVLALTAIVAGLCTAFAAVQFSRPDELDLRMAGIRQMIKQIDRLESQPGRVGDLPLGAVCSMAGASGVQGYRQTIERQAAAYNVPTKGLTIAAPPARAEGALSPLTVQWKGRGSYDGFVSVLGALSREEPNLFVDALDMKPRQGEIEFDLKGTVWCWTSANMRS